jgi:hypothetical protein
MLIGNDSDGRQQQCNEAGVGNPTTVERLTRITGFNSQDRVELNQFFDLSELIG